MARALTKRHRTGKLYSRPPEVESKIDDALGQDVATLRRRVLVRDSASPEFLESECLVHLIRNARRREDDATLAALFPVLLARCEDNLKASLSRTLANTTDLTEEILGRFAELFAVDGSGDNPDQLDYYECRFNSAFRTIRIDAIRSETARLGHIAQLTNIRDDPSEQLDEDEWAKVSAEFQAAATQEDAVFLGELRAAIDALPADERAAFVVCQVLGYKVESKDPKEQTAATHCGVSGRTIRTRLSRAVSRLARFKKEVRP